MHQDFIIIIIGFACLKSNDTYIHEKQFLNQIGQLRYFLFYQIHDFELLFAWMDTVFSILFR